MPVGYLLFIAPAMLLGFLAQLWVKSAYSRAQRLPSRMSGYEAARRLLDHADLSGVEIEQVAGVMTDHYDPRAKVLRLSGPVFHGRSLAAVGIAAHEAGHAMQDAQHYLPLVLRNAAVPLASFGSNSGLMLVMLGLGLSGFTSGGAGFGAVLVLLGVGLFSATVFFQVINLPVEFNASGRAKRELTQQAIVAPDDMPYIRSVLSAAALTYVAATLQSVLSLVYLLMRMRSRQH